MTMTFEQMQEILARTTILTERNAESITRLESSVEETRSLVDQNAREIREVRSIAEQSARNLTRLEAIVDSNARAIEATNNSLNAKFDQIADAVIRGQDRLERLEHTDRRYQAEIRGLRIETRRILERWLGEPFTDDPDLDSEEDGTP